MAVMIHHPHALVQEYAGAIEYLLHGQGPNALAASLSPEYADLLGTTVIEVHDHPSGRDLRLAGTPKGSLLLGLYTTPPARIQVFAVPTAEAGQDPVDVFEHELGHRFGFDHSTHPVQTGLFVDPSQGPVVRCTSYHPELAAAVPTAVADSASSAALVASGETCPVCRVHKRTAEAMALARGLRTRAWLAAQPTSLPLGLGGTIPLMRAHLVEARKALPEVATLLPDRTGEIRSLDRQLVAALDVMQGDHLTTLETTPMAEATEAAWSSAYSLAHHYFLHQNHPTIISEQELHDIF